MRHVMITGASRGIGLALARAHLAAGWRVTGTHRGDPGDARIGWLRADVTDAASLHAAAAVVGPGLDRLVCNAGVYPDKGQGGIADLTPEAMATAFAVNVTGVAMTVQAFLPALRASRGQIAIIGSQMGSTTRAPGGSLAYRASKSAVLNLGRNLAADLAGDGITVGVWHPGWVRTDMGGAGADIGVDEAAAGLMERFAALSPATSGLFEGWDGRVLPF